MEHFCCLKITLSRNFCSLDLVRPPFLRITPVNQIYSYPLKDEILTVLGSRQVTKNTSPGLLCIWEADQFYDLQYIPLRSSVQII